MNRSFCYYLFTYVECPVILKNIFVLVLQYMR